ncbi:hypothetical protein [Yokenella regensburgei]|uniref:hypothetical protein n=1 Tax=Yokenella regensburgei TaxID=158877 RepID=UPI001376114B|nr:hypothetical protein [Yokenella regensburgei]KAF1368536.1 hypothetical protein FHR25_002741 [Yokenella regensburgei]
MRKYGVILLAMMSFPALASVTCTTTNTGTTYCTGTDSTGAQVNTESRTSNTGTTTVTGRDGDRVVNSECRTSNTGTTYCR